MLPAKPKALKEENPGIIRRVVQHAAQGRQVWISGGQQVVSQGLGKRVPAVNDSLMRLTEPRNTRDRPLSDARLCPEPGNAHIDPSAEDHSVRVDGRK